MNWKKLINIHDLKEFFIKIKWILSHAKPVIPFLIFTTVISSASSLISVYNTLISKSLIDNASKALSKGGLIDTLKSNVCQLSERLNIYLPICRTINSNMVTPEVVYAPLKTINPLNP